MQEWSLGLSLCLLSYDEILRFFICFSACPRFFLSNWIHSDTMEIPAYTVLDEGTDLLWSQFQHIVKELNWTTDDNTS